MKITKLWDGLKRIANGDYVLEGDLTSEENIEIDLDDRLVVVSKLVGVSKLGLSSIRKSGFLREFPLTEPTLTVTRPSSVQSCGRVRSVLVT